MDKEKGKKIRTYIFVIIGVVLLFLAGRAVFGIMEDENAEFGQKVDIDLSKNKIEAKDGVNVIKPTEKPKEEPKKEEKAEAPKEEEDLSKYLYENAEDYIKKNSRDEALEEKLASMSLSEKVYLMLASSNEADKCAFHIKDGMLIGDGFELDLNSAISGFPSNDEKLSKTLSEMEKAEFKPFSEQIKQGAKLAIVTKAVVSEDGLPACLSYNVVTKALRIRLGFSGVVMTDALNDKKITDEFSVGSASFKALSAGVDIMYNLENPEKAHGAIVDAVTAGEIPESRIDESVRRILKAYPPEQGE